MTRPAIALVLLLLPRPVAAQEIDPKVLAAAAGIAALVLADDLAHEHAAWSVDRRPRADWISTGVVAGAIALPCLEDRTARCLQTSALRVGLAVGVAESAKYFIHRDRPDKSDRKSFFSEHTALACVGGLSSKRQALGAVLCAAAGYLRVAADKHWVTDVLVGAGVGFGLSRIAR
jgi:membrane-associated phospholipid phosphatase